MCFLSNSNLLKGLNRDIVSLPSHIIVRYELLGRQYLYLRSFSTERPRAISARFLTKGLQKSSWPFKKGWSSKKTILASVPCNTTSACIVSWWLVINPTVHARGVGVERLGAISYYAQLNSYRSSWVIIEARTSNCDIETFKKTVLPHNDRSWNATTLKRNLIL